MTRFFMTIPEASWLILDAAALAEIGDLFVLDMGEPVRIMDLARDVARLAGRDPDSQPIEIVGIRPGEKLHEELFYDIEQVEPTETDKVLRSVAQTSPPDVRGEVARLIAMATGQHEAELREALLEYAQGTLPVPVSAVSNSEPVGVLVGREPMALDDRPTAPVSLTIP
jgi:FlaA1/EpsC-like NDP-sugar epimerase